MDQTGKDELFVVHEALSRQLLLLLIILLDSFCCLILSDLLFIFIHVLY